MMELLVFVQLHVVEKWQLYKVKKSGHLYHVFNTLTSVYNEVHV